MVEKRQVDVSCVIHVVVSFLCSEDLLTYLSVFRKDSVVYKSICDGFAGVFKWPLLRAQCEPTAAGEHNIVLRWRSFPGKLAQFPHMQELLISTNPQKVMGTFVHNVMREVRATLLCGQLRNLKRLIMRNVFLDPFNSAAMQTDLPAILREASLQSLEFVELNMQELIRDENPDPEDEGTFHGVQVFVIRHASLARDVIGALAKLPLLRDFDVQFPPLLDLSSMFMRHRWPSLTVLRSNFILRRYSHSQLGFGDYWALGNFPRVDTLVVGEWSSEDDPPRRDLLFDLPKGCGMKQITTLVLTGRVLKNPLLGFRSTNAPRPVGIPVPLFDNVRTLDISHLFVPVPFTPHEARFVPLHVMGPYDLYEASFCADTVRAVQNISAALRLTDLSLPTLVASDAFFGAEGLALAANEAILGSIVDCLHRLRPAKLVLHKLVLHREANVHRGQTLFLDCPPGLTHATTENFAFGLRRYQYKNHPCAANPDPLDGLNLPRFLAAMPGLHAYVSELEVDCAFLLTRASMLGLIFKLSKPDDWLAEGMESSEEGGWGEEEEEDREVTRELFAVDSFWQFHRKVVSMSDAARERVLGIIDVGTVPLCDLGAALRPFHALRRIVVDNERLQEWCPHSPDLDMLARLPPPACRSLVVRGVYGATEAGEFRSHVWEPLLAGNGAKRLHEFFGSAHLGPRDTRWVESRFTVTVLSVGGGHRMEAEMRSFSSRMQLVL